MNLDVMSYCSRELQCACGKTHFCPIEAVVIESGALRRLPDLLQPYRRILLVADVNTWAACGESVQAILSSQIADTLIFARNGVLVPDEAAVAELEGRLTDEIDFILGVGSGVVNDICKYVAFRRSMEYMIVATAPSMDGYASSGAAMIMGGMKVTYTTRPPKYILADTDVLRNAPLDMIRSGYGDIIGKYSSLNDWRLSHLIRGEYLCPEIYDLVMRVTNATREQTARIMAREEQAIEFLTGALVLIGVTLSLVGSTRPGSGSEHHLSHFFEITGLIHDKPYFLHGTDVAYSTIVTAGLREKVVALSEPVFTQVSPEIRSVAYRRIYGNYAGEVQALQDEAGSYERDLIAAYREHWQEIRAILAECPSAAELSAVFEEAGYDLSAFEAMYGKEKIDDAILYGKDLKDRYSVLWLYYALFA